MNNITVYSKDYCPYCKSAKALLESRGMSYTEIDVGHHPEKLIEMVGRSNRRSVPQIFIDGMHVGGSTDLVSYFEQLEGADVAPAGLNTCVDHR